MIINVHELLFDGEAVAAILRLEARNEVADKDYFRSTVSLIEEGHDPHTRKRLTQSGLKVWIERCKTPPTDEEPSHAIMPRTVNPSH